MDVVVTVKSGYSPRAVCSFKSGEVVAEFSVGSQGDWLLFAPGVEGAHLRLAFDGKDLYAATAAAHIAVRLGNAPLDEHWRQVVPPAELSFGDARLEVTSADAGAAMDRRAERLPRYFVDMVKSPASHAEVDDAFTPPRESGASLRWAALAVAVIPVLVALVWFWSHRQRPSVRAPNAVVTSAAPSVAGITPRPDPVEPLMTHASTARAAPPSDLPTSTDTSRPGRAFPQNIADRPVPRIGNRPWLISEEWENHHERLLALPTRARAEVVFLGDSITEAWRLSPSYDKYFGRYSPLDLGISGDYTQNLLWRIEHGEVDGLGAKVAVVMIGVNNLAGSFSPEQTASGVHAVLAALRARLPSTFILLLEILPARQLASDPLRQKIHDTNVLLEKLAEPGKVSVHDVGARLLEPDGSLSKETARDFLHPTSSGYERMSEAVAPLVDAALNGRAAAP
jgi:beta-glucosidase